MRIRIRAVAVDMDNTLILGRTILAIGAHAGLGDAILDVVRTQELADRCRTVARYLSGTPVSTLTALVEHIPLDAGASRFVADFKAHGTPVFLLTDSYSQIAAVFGSRAGIDRRIANPLEVREGRFTGRVLDWRSECGIRSSCEVVHKKEAIDSLASHLGISTQEFAMVGDGRNDVEAMDACGVAIAIRPQPGVEEHADAVVDDLAKASARILAHR